VIRPDAPHRPGRRARHPRWAGGRHPHGGSAAPRRQRRHRPLCLAAVASARCEAQLQSLEDEIEPEDELPLGVGSAGLMCW